MGVSHQRKKRIGQSHRLPIIVNPPPCGGPRVAAGHPARRAQEIQVVFPFPYVAILESILLFLGQLPALRFAFDLFNRILTALNP